MIPQPMCKFKSGMILRHKTSGKVVQILHPFSTDERLAPYMCNALPYYSCRMPDCLPQIFIFYEVELEPLEEVIRA